MASKHKKTSMPLLLIGFVILLGVSIFIGFLIINSTVNRQFGSPASNLSITQRLIYPIELFLNRNDLITPRYMVDAEQTFEIGQGESISMVCIRLEQVGLIDDAELLRIYLVYSGLDRHLQSGRFVLSGAMSPVQISASLLDATPKDAVVTVLPGWRIEEVAANISRSGLSINSAEFISAAYAPSNEYLSYLPVDHVASLEGFLFPGTYVFPRETGLDDVVEHLLTEFSKNVDATLMDGFERQGLNLYEAIILASIIEKEAVVDEEKPLIASVFYNRLAQGWRLETDPTVQYGLGFQTETQSWWKSPLALSDLKVDSPHNTYIVFGLPPTPICNPDMSSLRAVAFPAVTPYYFFRAACDGSGRHNFGITYQDHLNNACE